MKAAPEELAERAKMYAEGDMKGRRYPTDELCTEVYEMIQSAFCIGYAAGCDDVAPMRGRR